MENDPSVHTSDIILSMVVAAIKPGSLWSNVKPKSLSWNNLFHNKTPIPPNQLPFQFIFINGEALQRAPNCCMQSNNIFENWHEFWLFNNIEILNVQTLQVGAKYS